MADKKILIVEDNAIIAMETIERLKRLGYLISGVAATGPDAISLAGSARPDLILMDINLKGEMDGIEAAREILAKNPVPLIYLTAYSDEETLKRAMASQPFKYLVKPYRERELYTSIEDAFRSKPGAVPVALPEKTRRFIDCLNSCEDAIIAVGHKGDVVYLNRKAGKITGYTTEELAGKPLSDVMTFESQGTYGPDTASKAAFAATRCPPCTLLASGGSRIPACITWINTGCDTMTAGLALAVFWENSGESP